MASPWITSRLLKSGIVAAEVARIFSNGVLYSDSAPIILGTGSDDTIVHNGTLTTWTHTTGDLVIDNTDVNDQIILRVGTDTSATGVEIRNNSDVAVFKVEPRSASEGTITLAGLLVQTSALSAASVAHSTAATVNLASGAAAAISASITTVTTAHTSGVLSAVKAAVTSLAGDTGGVFACVEMVSTDGGGTTPTHAGLYCASPLDALLYVDATGSGGVVVGAMTAKSPETDAEAGYISVRVGATRYEIPFYAVA